MKKIMTIVSVLIYLALLTLAVSCKSSLASQNGKKEFKGWKKEHKDIDKAQKSRTKGPKNEPEPAPEELQLWLDEQPLKEVLLEGKEVRHEA